MRASRWGNELRTQKPFNMKSFFFLIFYYYISDLFFSPLVRVAWALAITRNPANKCVYSAAKKTNPFRILFFFPFYIGESKIRRKRPAAAGGRWRFFVVVFFLSTPAGRRQPAIESKRFFICLPSRPNWKKKEKNVCKRRRDENLLRKRRRRRFIFSTYEIVLEGALVDISSSSEETAAGTRQPQVKPFFFSLKKK